jgi:hypothetical protein
MAVTEQKTRRQRVASYFVQSLVDGARAALTDREVMDAVTAWRLRETDSKALPPTMGCTPISRASFDSGYLDAKQARDLIRSIHPVPRGRDSPRIVTVTLAAAVYVREAIGPATPAAEPRTIVPLLLSAQLRDDGALFPADDGAPWIPRALLKPLGFDHPCVGELRDLESAIAQLKKEPLSTWTQVLSSCDRTFESVAAAPLKGFQFDGYELVEGLSLVVVAPERLRISHRVRHVLEGYTKAAAPSALFDAYVGAAATAQPLAACVKPMNLVRAQKFAAYHLGQMSHRHALSPNQRQALHQVIRANLTEPVSIVAVNGPPGTGKTTLLQSVVASLWVQRAVEGKDPPLISATSTNNQAVTNILDSFEAALGAGDSDGLGGRWLPFMTSYGLFHASTKVPVGPRQYLRGGLTGESNLPLDVRGADELQKYKAAFVQCAKHWDATLEPCVADVVERLHQQLMAAAAEVADGTQRLSEFLQTHRMRRSPEVASAGKLRLVQDLAAAQVRQHQIAAASKQLQALAARIPALLRWLSWLIWLIWPSAFPVRRAHHLALLRSVGSGRRGEGPTEARTEALLATLHRRARTRVECLERRADNARVAEKRLRSWLGHEANGLDLDELQSAAELILDTQQRHRAFCLATHYWEGRWLQEVRARQQAPREPDQRAHMRLAMLAPCHVVTCFSLPRAADVLLPKSSGLLLDLLIVDEAGQVSPEVGAAAFTFARHALVVGDSYQLEPVWNVPDWIDRANLAHHDISPDHAAAQGLSAATGSVLNVAQAACGLRQFALPHPPGLFLTEHRRCVDPIIEYCNELAYGGVLQPLRGRAKAGLNLPPMALIPIRSTAESLAGSWRNRSEALALVRWIGERLGELCAHYGYDEADATEKLIGIVTPFRLQADEIKRQLKSQKLPQFTTGTVHSLQGAERDVILFSPTYSADGCPGTLFFDRGVNMLNVAVSRAKDHFIVFGDDRVLRDDGSARPSALLRRRLEVRDSKATERAAE